VLRLGLIGRRDRNIYIYIYMAYMWRIKNAMVKLQHKQIAQNQNQNLYSEDYTFRMFLNDGPGDLHFL